MYSVHYGIINSSCYGSHSHTKDFFIQHFKWRKLFSWNSSY